MKLSARKMWTIWAMAGLFYLYEYILRVSPQVVIHTLMDTYHLNAYTFGLMSAVYYWAYVPLQIPCGYILDKFGVKNVVTISTLLCTIGCAIFAHTETLAVAYLGRFLMGAGSACAYVACMKVGVDWFSPKQFPLIAGLTLMMGQIGSSFGTHPFGFLVNNFGYTKALNILVFIGILIAMVSFMIIPSHKKTDHQKIKLLETLNIVIRSKTNWIFAIYGLLLYVGIAGFAELWSLSFLIKKLNTPCYDVASLPIMFFIGVGFGSPLISKFGKDLKIPYITMAGLGFLGSVIFLLFLFLPLTYLQCAVALFLLGSICGGHVLCFVCAKEKNSAEVSGTTLGFINAVVMMSGLLFQPLIGFILEMNWNGLVDKVGVPVYSLEAFQRSLFTVFICYLSAFILIIYNFKKEILNELNQRH
jgi:MFS family permease